MSRFLTGPRLALLGAITALGSLGTQMFLPGLPAAARELGVGSATIQLAVSIYLVGLGVGQLIWGPVSDTVGRRPVMLIGIGLFAVGSLAAGIAPTALLLMIGRLIQAIGGSAALIACRALVADTAERDRVVSSLAALSSITLISPTLAPLLGGLIVAGLGWRAVFAVLMVLSLLCWIALRLGPGRALDSAPTSGRPPVLADYLALLSSRAFQLFTLGNALTSSSLYIFLGLSPFLLLQNHHLATIGVGFCYLVVAGAIIIGTLCVRPLERTRPSSLFPLSFLCMGAAALWLMIDAISREASLALFLAPVALFGFGSGISGPAALGGALDAGAMARGSASSIFGATQMLVSGVISAIAAQMIGSNIVRALPLAIAIDILLAVLVLAAALRQRGQVRRDVDTESFPANRSTDTIDAIDERGSSKRTSGAA